MNELGIIAFFFGFWVLVHNVTKAVRVTSQERTRREIAAYIAEGTMTPEQGERLLRAGRERDE